MKPEPPITLPVEHPRLCPIEFALEGLSREQATIRLERDGSWVVHYHLANAQSDSFPSALEAGHHLAKARKKPCKTSPPANGSWSAPTTNCDW